jgi:ferredoxin-NADP reductase
LEEFSTTGVTLVLPAREILQATARTRIITVDLGATPFSFRAGQAVFAGLADGAVRRPYSIACSPGQTARTNTLELLVLIDDHEAPDPHLERAVSGTLLRIEGPFGSFGVPSPLPERHLLLIAGGTGIAPLRSIMWDTLEHDADVDVTLLYSARSPEEFAYLDELRGLAAEGRIRLTLTVTRDNADSWIGTRGRMDVALITSSLTTTDTRCVVCGPPALVSHATGLLRDAGVAAERIATETFAA